MTAKHGMGGLKQALRVRGMDALDRRTSPVRLMEAFRSELVVSLGGEESLSAQELALVEMVCRTRLLLDHCDSYLLGLPSVINRRRKALVPLVRERMQLQDSLARLLGQLGVARRHKPVPSLAEYLASRDEQPSEEPEQEEPIVSDSPEGGP
jgi:hypothetical protein